MGSLQTQNPHHYNSNYYSRRSSMTASNIRNNNLRDQTNSFRYNIIKEEIDPTTYSFNTALKALQARSPDGYALNSKWDEAEKYICNPHSGEFPMECLSSFAKTQLSTRSFRRITVSTSPSVCPTHSRRIERREDDYYDEEHVPFPSMNQAKEKKKLESMTRDVGSGNMLLDSCNSGGPWKPMQKTLVKQTEADGGDYSPSSDSKTLNFDKRKLQVDVKDMREGSEGTRKEVSGKEAAEPKCERRQLGGSCLSLKVFIGKSQREKHKPRKGCMHVRIRGC